MEDFLKEETTIGLKREQEEDSGKKEGTADGDGINCI